MVRRLELQTLFVSLMENENVYFQPPSNLNMKYPALRYELSDLNNRHANNAVYAQKKAYKITLIDEDPDSIYVSKISKLPKCRFDTFYTADDLNHWVFTLYY